MDLYSATILADAPIGYYRLGEPSGSAAADSSGNGKTATYYGSRQQGLAGAIRCSNDGSVNFAGSGYARPADSSYWDGTSGSFECWFKTTANQLAELARHENSGNSAWDWLVRQNGYSIEAYAIAGDVHVTTGIAINDGNWHHVAATWSYSAGNTAMNVYLDGSLGGTGTRGGANAANGGAPTLGCTVYGGSANEIWAGSMDEAAIYSTALTAGRIKAHYLAGTSAGFAAGTTIR